MNREVRQWDMPWYDWLVFVVPALLIITLGLESALGPVLHPGDPEPRDFRAVAHWFDPVFFQYNLVMTLLAVLVVPSLALSYIQTMANRKERRLQREVPPERRAEIHKRMGRRASFSTYRGSVWLTTVVVLLGASILLLFKPVSSMDQMGVDFSLGANMLTIGPFAELYGKNPDAYFAHILRNLIAFQFGFLGAYIYFIGAVVRAYFILDLTSHTFVDGAIRMIVASILALVLSFAFHVLLPDSHEFATSTGAAPGASAEASAGTRSRGEASGDEPAQGEAHADAEPGDESHPAGLSLLPVVAFFFGFYPKRASLALERVAISAIRNIIPGDTYRALPLSMLAGMSYSHELRLEREGYDNLENLSSADAVDLAVRTCFSYCQLQQWIDQAWLASRLREDYPDFARRTGISSSDELRRFLCCPDSPKDGIEQMTAALSADPADSASWKTRLTALRLLLLVDGKTGEREDSFDKGPERTREPVSGP